MQKEVTKLQAYRREIKTESESRISNCYCCGKEIGFGRIFCDVCNTSLNKQIYEFFSEFPKNKDGVLIRPRGEKLYQVIKYYLAARLGLSKDKRIVMKSCTGAGKSVMLDMLAFIEMTHFPNSLTIIGSISEAVSKMHIERLREWIGGSVFNRYMVGTQEATASKTEIKLAKLNSKVMAMPQSPKSRTGWHACTKGDTEVLSQLGWKKISTLEKNDIILGYDINSGDVMWQPLLAIEKFHHDGDMIQWNRKKGNVKFTVSENHRMLYRTQTHKIKSCIASDLSERKNLQIPVAGNEIINNKKRTHIKIGDKTFPIKLFLQFLGYFISEGWLHGRQVQISQGENSKYFKNFEKCLSGIWGHEISYDKKRATFTKGDVKMVRWLEENCGSKSFGKKVPRFIFKLDPTLINGFLQAYCEGDAHFDGGWVAHTVSKKLADDLQGLLILCGEKTSLHQNIRKQWKIRKLYGSKIMHFVPLPRKEHFNGFIYGIQVPSSYVIYRENNQVFVSGNSLLLVDEIGRMEVQSYYASFSQMAAQGGTEVLASTPYLDSIVMQNIWADDNIIKIALEPEECFWIPKDVFRKKEEEYRIGGISALYEQLYGAQFRSLTNRVIPDDLLLQSMSKGDHYPTSKNLIMGIDFGKSIDFTAIVVIDIETGDVKFVDTFQDDWPIQFAKIRKYVKEWNPIKIIADSSHIGDVILSDLRDLNIDGISMHNDILKKSVIDRLILAFFNNKLNIVSEEFPKLINEVSSYVYYDSEHKKMGPSGRGHDDTVIALSLALRGLDVTSVSDNPLPDNLWAFTRINERSSSNPWRISNV